MAGRGPSEPVFRDAFRGPQDEHDPNLAVRPFIFDVLGPDLETSLLPEEYRLVLHVNPDTFTPNYTKVIERITTRGGFVEQHWGDGVSSLDFNAATGGFMRLYTGLSHTTGGPGAYDAGGTRRETLAYDRYLDMLALFHNNGSVYDATGKIVFQGVVSISFDGGTYFGWFSNFTVDEAADKAYQFTLSANFTVSHEVQRFRSPVLGGGL